MRAHELRAALAARQLALVQMVTPVTEPRRLQQLCARSQGFVYAVTMTGTTGRSVAVPDAVLAYLDRVRAASPLPVCAGFGIRSREQVARLAGHVDGVVVGSALVEVLEKRRGSRGVARGPALRPEAALAAALLPAAALTRRDLPGQRASGHAPAR